MAKIAVIGGGTGLFTVLEGLKDKADLVAIVSSFDSGGSSGVLRDEFGILPPGDIRRCLVALSNSEKLMSELFEYRFEEKGSLQNHVFGNIFMLALVKVTGSYEKAIEELGKILAINGKVLPCTLEDNITLCAELANERVIKGEYNVGKFKLFYNTRIKRLYTEPQTKLYEKAAEEIMRADKIVLGPGSLYTSVLANLVIDDIPRVIKEAKGKKIYIVNIMTQHGETDNFTASQHVSELEKYLGRNILDYAVVNTEKAPAELLKNYEEEWKYQVEADTDNIEAAGIKAIKGNFLRNSNLLRHDKDKLAEAILSIG